MADKLLLLAENEELRRKMGACGAAKVRNRFSLDVMAPRLHHIIDELLGCTTLRAAQTP
jgi:glycosyltransferase involved in cell wall biosynthesis